MPNADANGLRFSTLDPGTPVRPSRTQAETPQRDLLFLSAIARSSASDVRVLPASSQIVDWDY